MGWLKVGCEREIHIRFLVRAKQELEISITEMENVLSLRWNRGKNNLLLSASKSNYVSISRSI